MTSRRDESGKLRLPRIADPGNGKTFAIQFSGFCEVVTAGAETRVLPNPKFPGQEFLLYLMTDGGDCVISVSSAINQTGNNVITLNDAGDTLYFRAIRVGTNYRWRVITNDGADLTTA